MEKDISILIDFIHVYCKNNHYQTEKHPISNSYIDGKKKINLCKDCTALVLYAVNKRINCPLTIYKPPCKKCRIKCYEQSYREKIQKVMKYSGIYFIKRGRIDYLIKYFL
ncbi:hypothetical protein HNQ80_001084 [Anaerosolibacter carboniphilus]|uniref:Nitrous oxide-stimulated promoter n=1 Tax=Anaerosolibacter carboniphilus TaxID=1417629 RepID=A0A841KXY0_9FIRM|nr:hypothetical protein [Anaerosolibacter carboniphilus]